jgi:hypothetical protein
MDRHDVPPDSRSANFTSSALSLIGTSRLPMAFSICFAKRRPSFSTIVMSTCSGLTPGSTAGETRPRSATTAGSRTARSLNCFSPAAPSTSATATAW